MIQPLRLLIIILLPIFSACSSFTTRAPSAEFATWASLKSPSTGEPRIYGTYQKGCITGAQQLPLEGPGYSVVHRSQQRYYGHPVMINYLTEIGKKIRQKKLPNMIVEDISYPRGGPFLSGHNSHQIGLDVDISLQTVRAPLTPLESDNWASASYVHDRKTLLPTWGPEQVQLTVLAANAPEVNRIFVAPAIKKYFCETQSEAPWLYKLRSWWGHDDHVHVRLNCPTDSLGCVSQAPLDPKNNGCGVELEWWFSAEADAQAKAMEQEEPPREFPELPAQCEAVKRAN